MGISMEAEGSSSSNNNKRPRRCRPQIQDLPAPILSSIFGLVSDVRSRNAMALVCLEWHQLERSTRLSLCLRGNVCDLHLLPSSFCAVETLDMSNCSPWGYSAFQQQAGPELAAEWLRRAFPSVRHLCVYVRDTVDIAAATWTWPKLETLRLVRWHQRAMQPEEAAAAGMELCGLLSACPQLVHLDLSRFYCWAEDIAPALQEPPGAGARLRCLNLLKLSSEGFKAPDMAAIASACTGLEELQALCDFDPRFLDAIGDECLLHLASCCANLKLLHLVDTSQFEAGGQPPQEQQQADEMVRQQQEARVTSRGLEATFQLLPKLEDLALLLGQNVPDSAPAFEALAKAAPGIRSLQLSHFQGLWRRFQADEGGATRLGGLAACNRLVTLFFRACDDLCNEGLEAIAKSCPGLSTLSVTCCPLVTEAGLATAAFLLRRTLACVDVRGCRQLPTVSVLRALSPVRANLRQLHVDCCWGEEDKPPPDDVWPSLRQLSLWAPAKLQLSSLPGLRSCPRLQEMRIRVEGDCRLSKRPGRGCEWGLRTLGRFPALSTMWLDLSNVVGYALSAPAGSADLSIWERFFLSGIQELQLYTLDYCPPSDRDVNCRGIALPGAGLLSLCSSLRQLFVHGTTYEHLFMMLLKIPNLRDVQLREDYYPTPESESSTELRIDSCRRFESFLATRGSPD